MHSIKENIYLCSVDILKPQKKRYINMYRCLPKVSATDTQKDMKHRLLILAGTAAALLSLVQFAATAATPVTGRVTATDGNPVSYANVVALQDNTQAAGAATDNDGYFTLSLNEGEYLLSIGFLGYTTVERTITVGDEAMDTGVIILEAESVNIDGVEVVAQIVRREADRFVVDVANMPSAAGKDGVELLEVSPGVFINGDNITIYGKSGTKVYINDREVRYTGDRLLSYLRNIKNEDIQRIEVVPIAGADMDADSSGGIIKITLRQRREDGVMGNITFQTMQSSLRHTYTPSFDIDYKTGKWTLSARGYYSDFSGKMYATDRTRYTSGSNTISSNSDADERYNFYGGKIGAIYEINDNHSVGAEVEYGRFNNKTETVSGSVLNNAAAAVTNSTEDLYNQLNTSDTFTARFNYIAKLDSLGSVLKVLADFTHQESGSNNDYRSAKQTIIADMPALLRDSLYRDNSGTNYNITTAGVDYNKIFSQKFSMSTGIKYTNNLMSSFSRYELLQGSEWMPREGEYDYNVKYTENIAALYIIGNAQLGRWGLSAGLRGEYTFTSGRNSIAQHNYFSLFPNASVSLALTQDRSYMLTGQYARTIRRPGFWALNPARNQMSEYLYMVGNPDLLPQFSNDVSLTAVMKYKYTITLGMRMVKNDIEQHIISDSENPDKNIILTDNLDHTEMYYASINLPFQLTKWWSLNTNITGGWNGTRIAKGDRQVFHPILMGSLSTTFNLPLGFYISLEYFGQSRMHISNISLQSRHSLSASLKKRLLNDKLSLSAGVYNILPPYNQVFTYYDANFVRTLKTTQGWNRPTFVFSVSYSFNSGRQFRKREIESSADTQRLSK